MHTSYSFIKIGITLLLMSFFLGCSEEEEQAFLSDMAEFDQAYIPVLYHVRLNQLDQANQYISNLEYNWQEIVDQYQNLYQVGAHPGLN